ncbi:MAG: quinone-dependent dihydroorotate dehydrogenase [Candidatus Velthaea sp.]
MPAAIAATISMSLSGRRTVAWGRGELPPKRVFVFDPYRFAKPLLHRLDPETAHELTLRALEAGIVPAAAPFDDPVLEVELFGRRIANPIGLAAGFDKNARVFARMYRFGFAFVEVGGVTPLPQAGNARPRVFRLAADGAVINRMGFPNDGAGAVARRLAAARPAGLLGINLAANADSADPAEDMTALVERFAPHADYLALDISCPNTVNGQVFLDPARLRDMLARIAARAGNARAPLVAKLSPDIDGARLAELVEVLLAARIDGIIVSNTMRARAGLRGAHRTETGGLSGRPLFAPSTAQLATVAHMTAGTVPLIGVGGIASGADAYAKIRAGATTVQLYTALVYEGTALVNRIKRELAVLLHRDGFASVGEAARAA